MSHRRYLVAGRGDRPHAVTDESRIAGGQGQDLQPNFRFDCSERKTLVLRIPGSSSADCSGFRNSGFGAAEDSESRVGSWELGF